MSDLYADLRDKYRSNLNAVMLELTEDKNLVDKYYYKDLGYDQFALQPLFKTRTKEDRDDKKAELDKYEPLLKSFFETRRFAVNKQIWNQIIMITNRESDCPLVAHCGNNCSNGYSVIDVRIDITQRQTSKESFPKFYVLGQEISKYPSYAKGVENFIKVRFICIHIL